MQLLVIKLNSIQAIPEYALLGKNQAEDRFTPSSWQKISSLTRGRRVLLVIPNNDVMLSTLTIPSTNKKQLLRAVPFALEDSLAEDLENLHFAIHKQSNSDKTNVAVINHQRLGMYTALLREHKITPYYVLPQLLAQHYQKDSWSVLKKETPQSDASERVVHAINSDKQTLEDKVIALNKSENDISVRTGVFSGFNSHKNLLNLFLVEHFESHPTQHIYTNLEQTEFSDELKECEFKQLDANLINYKSATEGLALNLLTGYIQKGGATSSINWKAWRPAMLIGGLLATTWIAILGLQNNQLKQQRKQIDSAINNVFLESFPSSRVVDAPQQMKSKLAALQQQTGKTSDSVIPLIADIAPLLKKHKDITLNELRYQDGELLLKLNTPNLSRLNAFKKEAKESAGLNVKVKDSSTTANKVEANVIISPLSSNGKQQAMENKA